MSVIYKEREREREWDTTTSRSGGGGGGGGGYTTVRRYKIPDRSLEEEDVYESELKIVHRGRNDFEERRSTKDYASERDDQSVRQVREYRYVNRSPSPRGRDRDERDVREYRIQREYERSPSPSTIEEIRISRDYEREREIPREEPYELERYSRSTEYFRPEPQQSQPIIIRNEAPYIPQAPQPIIIREEAPQQTIIIREREREREPAYELIERKEVIEDRQVTRPRREHDDHFYERKVKEVDRGGRVESRYVEEREYDHDRYGGRDYYSDDGVVRIHKEKDTWGGGSDIHAKRDIATGALAGVAAGQIVRHHRKRKGEAAGGNIGNALGYGTLGAVGAVVLDKFNNRDRSRSLSSERGRGRGDKSRHRSKSRVKELGALAAIAGVGALAYAAGRNKNKETVTVTEKHRHRSRSRRGRGRSKSVTVIETDGDRSRSRSKHRHSSKHRNNKAAQVGLASAAVAGLVERHRSKSRKREGKRSHSRVREGVPIAAAGVAGAAITGLYEKHKAKKEDRAVSRSRSRSKSRSRSRSVLSRITGRSRSRGGSTVSEPVLVEYGGDPIYTDPSTKRRSHRRHRRRSSSSSGHRHGSRSRSRSKSRTRSAAETAAVAGVAGLAAVEATKRRDRKKAEKERERERERDRRREEDSAYSTGTYSPDYSPQPSHMHPHDSRQFPEGNYFPPPPTAAENNYHGAHPAYNPAEYPVGAQPNYGPVPSAGYVQPPHEDVNLGNPYAPQYQHDMQYNQQRRHDDHVSASTPTNPGNEHINFASARDNVGEPEAPSPTLSREKTVQFNLAPEEEPSRKSSPRSQDDHDDTGHRQRNKDDDRSRRSGRDNDRHRRHDSPNSDASDETVDLPSHSDEQGRRKQHDPLAERLESVLQTLFR